MTVAEVHACQNQYEKAGDASMGPQLDSCGRELDAGVLLLRQVASMGPQLDSCGRRRVVAGGLFKNAWLQWGRNLTVAEGLAQIGSPPVNLVASMGPQLDSCGRVGLGVDSWLGPMLQLVGEYCLFFYETTATAHPSYIAKLTKLTKSVNLRGHSSPSGPRRRRSADGWCRRGVPVFPAANRHSLANPMLVSGREGG